MSRLKPGVGLVTWLVLCVGGGALIGLATQGGDSAWYAALAKPTWTPPSWIFGPVWTLLYASMAVAAWLVWRDGGWGRHGKELGVFLGQLALNFAWSFLFFSLKQPVWALADILVLWALIAVTILVFGRRSRVAAALLLPYLAWVSFAAALNAAIVRLN